MRGEGLDFLRRPVRLASEYTAVVVPESPGVVVYGQDEWEALEGAIFPRLLPLLDGRHDVGSLVRRLAKRHPKVQVIEAIVRLYDAGWLRVIDTAGADRLTAHPRNTAAPASRHRIDGARVHLCAGILESDLAAVLDAVGLAGRTGESELDLVATADYLGADVEAFSLRAERPWMLFRPSGADSWLGPILVPGRTACWECLAHRLRLNRQAQLLGRRDSGSAGPRIAPSVTTLATIVGHAAVEIERWLRSRGEHPLIDGLLALPPGAGAAVRHPIERRPNCARCGDPGAALQKPIRLASRRRHPSTRGGHRHLPTEAILERFGRHVSPITGVVSRLRTVERGPLPVASARFSPPLEARSWADLLVMGRNNAAGKGVDEAQARASALMEALERYSSFVHGTEEMTRASYSELAPRALHPNDGMLFSPAQLRDRATVDPLDPEDAIDWVRAWSLTGGEWRWVAAAQALLGVAHAPGRRYCVADSNGNAAGASLEDAILQGFLELVERDAIALWWYTRAPRPGLPLAGLPEEYVAGFERHQERLGREFWLLDLTSDLEIPACAAISRRRGSGPDEVVMGFGAHLDPRIARLRALSEVNQPLAFPRSRSDRAAGARTSFDLAVADSPYLLPDPSAPRGWPEGDRFYDATDLREEVEHCRKTVEGLGMEMIVLDLTRPDIGAPVVKVIVPGLRHHRRRLAPGRLYDVPLRLGWLPQPLREEDVNPVELDL